MTYINPNEAVTITFILYASKAVEGLKLWIKAQLIFTYMCEVTLM
jgi:hypothetical protein